MKNPFGFLIIDKPAGVTSHDCVNIIRKVYKTKRVGHGGTLDPAVTGVLPIAIGNATRLFQYLPSTKTYNAIIQLGKQTSTDDIHGEIISEKEWPLLEEISINNFLNQFRGPIEQEPPIISSIHFQGERAYKRARKGESFKLPSRKVTIYDLEFCNWNQDTGRLKLKIDCSSGTYIRSLARDLGQVLNCGGCLLELRRIQSQGFKENQAISLPYTKDDDKKIPKLLNPLEALEHMSQVKIMTEKDLDRWRRGQQLNIENNLNYQKNQSNDISNQYLVVIDNKNVIAGIGEKSITNKIKPKIVFNAY